MTYHIPTLIPPPETGNIQAPNGYGLYWKMTEQGREWYSDECGPINVIWHTAITSQSTLLLAMAKEAEFQYLEAEIRRRSNNLEHEKKMEELTQICFGPAPTLK